MPKLSPTAATAVIVKNPDLETPDLAPSWSKNQA